MWQSKTKNDLIIEVWEKLDCESIGAKEIIAIEEVINEVLGKGAVDLPMQIARLLADEGAELRHSEIMKINIERLLESPYDAIFRNILKFSDFKEALNSIRQLENLRRKFLSDKNKEALALLRKKVIQGKERTLMISKNEKVDEKKRLEKAEISEWFSLWLQSPEIFENWIQVRLNSKDFKENFE
jgi:hypothetical protein